MSDTLPIENIRQAFETYTGRHAKSTSRGYQLHCPTHPDRTASVSLHQNNEHHALLRCHAGCETPDMLAAVGLSTRDLYPIERTNRSKDPVVATYRYTDEQGQLLYEVQRTVSKRFLQRRPDPDRPGKMLYNLDGVRRVLYRLPLVTQAVREGQRIWLVEGEKDVHTLEGYGQVATTSPGGAGKWRDSYAESLAGALVTIVADMDQPNSKGQTPGLEHARTAARSLMRQGALPEIVAAATGKDITDHLLGGHGLDETTHIPIEPPAGASEADGDQRKGIDDAIPVSPAPSIEDQTGVHLRLTPASEFKMRPVRWVWQGRMPLGEICLIPGREGIGKSTFLAWLAGQITRGTLPGVYEGQPRAVFYAASEDAWDYTVAPRLHAAGADLTMVYRIDVVDYEDGIPGKLTLPKHTRLIPAAAEQHKAAILMCDPILSLLDERVNPNHSRELRTALEPLRDVAEQAGIAVAALAHFNKNRDAGDAGSMVSGSRAWVEVARAMISIAREERDTEQGTEHVQVLTQSKNNLGSLDIPSMEYVIDTYRFPTDEGDEITTGLLRWTNENSATNAEEILQRRPGQRPDRSGMARTTAAVLDFLDDQVVAVSPRQVADALPDVVNHANARQLMNRLAARGEVERIGTGLYRAVTPADEASRAEARGGAYTSPRARDAPSDVTSHLPPPVRGGGGGDSVTGVTPNCDSDSDSRGGRGEGVTAASRTLIACDVCFGPMEVVEPGQRRHPLCDERGE